MQTALHNSQKPPGFHTEEAPEALTLTPSFSNTAKEFLLFLRQPEYLPASSYDSRYKWQPFLQLFLMNTIATMSVAAIIYGFMQLAGLNPFEGHKVSELLKEMTLPVALLVIAIITPAVEEFFFRLPLRYSALGVILAVAAVSFFGLIPFLEASEASSSVNMGIALVLVAFAITFLASQALQQMLKKFWQQYFGIVFYTMALFFALIHLANFENLAIPVALIPFLVVPQLFTGFFCGYIRMKYGLRWAILNHGMFNGLLVLLSYATA